MKEKMRFFAQESNWIKAACAALILAITFTLFPFFATCEEISDNVLRLHILANSDSAEDQALKLKVRDAVLTESEKWYAGAKNFEEANTAICTRLQTIQAVAQTVLRENGSQDNVTAIVTEKYFTTRDYESFALPAGKYRTLQIQIGEAKGKNWWCMVYPALCVPASQGKEQEIMEDMPADEKAVISNPDKLQIKFKLVEWFEYFKSLFDK